MTAEYTQTFGGSTVGGALAAITTTINGVNSIYERNVAIRLILINRETEVIFTDAATDGYTSDNASTLLNENQTVLDTRLGAGVYDIGHVLDGRQEQPGYFSYQGVASLGVVCRDGFKARGVSILRSVSPSNSIAFFHVAHEMGHQFSARHTFNTAAGNCAAQRDPTSAYEPATGLTIMGYRFNCGEEDLRSSSLYFHSASVDQIIDYTTRGAGSSCPTITTNNNRAPVVTIEPNHYVPANIPFRLTATGSDPDNESVTYHWEELDLGNPSPPLTDDGTRPLYSSYVSGLTNYRFFPTFSNVLAGVSITGETLHTTNRTLHFRVIAHDNHDIAAFGTAETQINVVVTNQPFKVTEPVAGSALRGNSRVTVKWNVAGTDAFPFNFSNVRISYQEDQRTTFIPIVASTANDGIEEITVPPLNSSIVRIVVEPVGGVFYALSPTVSVSTLFCSYSTRQDAASVRPSGGNFSVTLSTNSSECPWSVNIPASVDWITPTTPASGFGNAVISFKVAPNATGSMRAGNFGVANNGHGIDQPGTYIDAADNFVRQQYQDFLARNPDPNGSQYWTAQIRDFCSPTDAACLLQRRISVSAEFFISLEFQESGYYVYRFYRAGLGRQPIYNEFTPDRAQVVGGGDLEQRRQQFADNFVQRTAFLERYPATLTNEQFVNQLFDTAGLTDASFAAERAAQINAMNTQGRTRAQVLRALIELPSFTAWEYNPAFVLMQYFGYLRRNPDQGGYDFWLNVLNNQNNPRFMVCNFITSAEYQLRFGSDVTRANAECVP